MAYKWQEGLRPVWVRWVDSMGRGHWSNKDDIKEDFVSRRNMECYSAGFLLDNNEDSVVIIQSIGFSEYANTLKIPKVAIKEMRFLQFKGRK